MGKIEVIPYDKKWKLEFEKAYTKLSELLEDFDLRIEHVGSASVEGLMAKPILDIDIIVPNEEASYDVIEKLKSVGYIHIGDCGVFGREAFKYAKDNKFINWMKHHLYVCIEGNLHVINHLLLRDHLRNNEKSKEAYGKLKKELARKYPYDIDSYIEGKTKMITSFLKSEGMSNEGLNIIKSINKKDN